MTRLIETDFLRDSWNSNDRNMLSNEKDPTVSRGNGLFVRSITATEVHGGCQLGDTGSKDLPSCLLERNPSNEPTGSRFLSIQPEFQESISMAGGPAWARETRISTKNCASLNFSYCYQ